RGGAAPFGGDRGLLDRPGSTVLGEYAEGDRFSPCVDGVQLLPSPVARGRLSAVRSGRRTGANDGRPARGPRVAGAGVCAGHCRSGLSPRAPKVLLCRGLGSLRLCSHGPQSTSFAGGFGRYG